MERHTHPIQAKSTTKAAGDNPAFTVILYAIGGFILAVAVILIISTY